MYASGDKSSHPSQSQENAPRSKWQGIFVPALRGVQNQVQPGLVSSEDALEFIEELMVRLLTLLCAGQPHTIENVEERIIKAFPDPIDKWAIKDAQAAIKDGKNKKNSILLPVDKIHPRLREEFGYTMDFSLASYIVAVLEYIAADILKISGIYVKNIRHDVITYQDIKVAICADQVLYDMFFQEEDVALVIEDEPAVRREKMTYEEIVKDFIVDETQYLRDLNMIIKVFRFPFVRLFHRSKDLDVIFSNILDIYDCTAKLLRSVEDQVEMAQEGEVPVVGTCFADLTEGEEFTVYERYVADMLAPQGKRRLHLLLGRDDVIKELNESGHGFREAFKYVLPKLLMGPVYHCLQYFELVKDLINTSPSEDDKECLAQADGLLQALRARLERQFSGNIPKRKNWEVSLRMQAHVTRSQSVQKMQEIQKSIDGWEGKEITQSCSEFIMEGPLLRSTGRRTSSERHVFLFDGLIVLCKANPKRTSGTGSPSEYKFKEKYLIRKVEVVDKTDTDEFSFEIRPREQTNFTLQARTVEEKTNWMAALISLQTRSMLERNLDGILREEEKNHPLVPPSPSLYEFAVEDSDKNIIFEENQESSYESPLIKGGQLIKLVERLTYHMYADPRFLRTFLLTYRSFCSPRELLDLLIKRFEIPEPIFAISEADDDNVAIKNREDLKRFRTEYLKPVQFRVVNVFRHWVDNHFYDFQRDPELLEKLNTFLKSLRGKAVRKMADFISKSITRKMESSNTEREFTFQEKPPRIEWHIARKREDFNLMTLHPIEIARQVTLLEFDLYRAVKPSELVGMPWTKKDKQQTAPNLLKMIQFSTNFTYWLELCIVETYNLEERVSVMSRIVEIMLVLQDLNNFNGVMEISSALNSASIFRLEHSKREMPHKYQKAVDDISELNNDHFKKYIEKLRSINPPCVPFLGMYLTNILLTEEGNPDFVANAPEGIINFSKRRKVAEITSEIQQFQNQPYCFAQENSIRDYFATLDPLAERSMTVKELEDHLYKTSLEIEPRDGKLPRFQKKFEYSLKSPGIKPTANRHGSSTKNSAIPSSLPKTSEEDDSSPSGCVTPTSPKPLSPSATSTVNSVFVNSPGASSSPSQTSMMHFANVNTASASEEEEVPHVPPPLPPRQRGNSSAFQEPPPTPPPRVESERPPPVPPRPNHNHAGACFFPSSSLARSQSVSHPRNSTSATAFFPGSSNTLPRQSMERHSLERNFALSSMELNGNDDAPEHKPMLPPRTYRAHLSSNVRNQSS